MKPWKLLDTKYLVDAPWLKVAKETCELPNGKVIDDFYTLWQPDWVLILARTYENRPQGAWVMTHQYRHGTGQIALEFPAGIIDRGETPEQAAVRELHEECGYIIDERRKTKDERRQMQKPKPAANSFDIGEAQHLGGGAAKTTNEKGESRDCVIQYLGDFPVNPDRHRGKFHVVFIDGVVCKGDTHFDDTEEIEASILSDEELQVKIANGEFNHPLQIAGYFKWKLQCLKQ